MANREPSLALARIRRVNLITNKQGGEEQEGEEQEPEATEGEEQEQEPQEQETELEEGSFKFSNTDWLSLAVFGAGIFLEKTKRV